VDAIDRLQELRGSSGGMRRPRAAISARRRCRKTIWNVTVAVGLLLSGTAVLFNLLIEESIQIRLISALIVAAVPIVAAVIIGAILVTLLGLLGIVYDVMRTLLVPALLYCVRSGTPVLVDGAYRLKNYADSGVGRIVDVLMRFAGDFAIGISQILRRGGTRACSGLTWMSREIALEAFWIKQGFRRVVDISRSIVCWQIRTSALLLLRLIERKRQA